MITVFESNDFDKNMPMIVRNNHLPPALIFPKKRGLFSGNAEIILNQPGTTLHLLDKTETAQSLLGGIHQVGTVVATGVALTGSVGLGLSTLALGLLTAPDDKTYHYLALKAGDGRQAILRADTSGLKKLQPFITA
ncbi:hypothetical protein [Moraxella nasicaprae]|uniref:Uncharacterized protein n=1 Tax=Moraxella nasicaprae TaxID=2904122 RepID=A0ABY6F4R6_9GAMM|nr:hypothetical protein [Moraxella nasicaprae]UXZ05094.1 hypothetical protein LU297_01155 [Moraxella nasicaprae]